MTQNEYQAKKTATRKKQNEYRRKKNAERKLLGICPCGRAEMEPGKKSCHICITHKKNKKIIRNKSGLCLCGRVLRPGKKSCQVCFDRDRSIKARYRQEGRCVKCGKERTDPNMKLCLGCRTYHKKLIKERHKKGLCQCGKPLEYFWKSRCKSCSDIQKEKYKERKKKVVKLYRKTTQEEKKKYGGKKAADVIMMVRQYLGEFY